MRTAGSECASNQVDAEAMLRFTLQTLGQFVDGDGRREKLRAKLMERAQRGAYPETDSSTDELKRLDIQIRDLDTQKETIEYRMARERDDALYAALSRQFQAVFNDRRSLQARLEELKNRPTIVYARTSIEDQVDGAMSLLDQIALVAGNPEARQDAASLLNRIGLRICLRFAPAVKGKKRIIQKLVSGIIVFGDRPLPVPLFGKDKCGPDSVEGSQTCIGTGGTQHTSSNSKLDDGHHEANEVKSCPPENETAMSALRADMADSASSDAPGVQAVSQPESISTTKVSRGDWIRTSDLTVPKRT